MNAMSSMPRSKAEHVAQQLLDRIITAGLAPGSSFGTEADLLTQFDVSRPTLRESLRILEAQGVLDLRPGPGGGIMVRKPNTDVLARGLSIFLRLNDVPFITVLKAREVIEPALAYEAAVNGTDEDFDDLQGSIDRLQDAEGYQDAFVLENRRFHSIVARASGNRVLEAFWSTISILASGEQHRVRYSINNQRHVVKAHQGILDVCRSRDGSAASAKMEAHITELETLIRRRYKDLLNEPTNIVERNGS